MLSQIHLYLNVTYNVLKGFVNVSQTKALGAEIHTRFVF